MADNSQCPGCNQWSDRSDEVKQIVSDTSHLSDKPYFACLNVTCEVYMFKKGASGPTAGHRLNLDGIRDSNKSVREVKNEKLDNHELN